VAVNLLTAFKFNFKVEIVGIGPHRPTGPKVKTVGSPPTLAQRVLNETLWNPAFFCCW